ncbi:hypothetical protein D3C78_657630 [compost metagenome]
MAVLHHHVALGDVAVLVLVVHFPDGAPAAHVVPAGGQRHHAGARRLLHHRVVDGIVRAAGEGGRIDAHCDAIALAALQGQQTGVVDVHLVLLEFLQEAAGAEQEHAAVPEVIAGFDVLAGLGFVRLLDELGDAADALRQAGVGLAADVAVAGFRALGGYAEEHHLALFGGAGGQRQGLLEGLLVAQHMVGRKDQHQLVTAFGHQLHGGDGHRRRGIAAEGLQQHGLGLQADAVQLLLDDEAVILVGHQYGRLHAFEAQALQGLLEQGLVAGEGEELLGILFARKRPEARAATAREDHGNHGVSPRTVMGLGRCFHRSHFFLVPALCVAGEDRRGSARAGYCLGAAAQDSAGRLTQTGESLPPLPVT